MIARNTIRTNFAALLTTNGSWQAVYTSEPKSFGGQSPVVTLHDGPLDWEYLAAGHTPDAYSAEIWLTNYVRRGPNDNVDTAETALDTLFAAAAAVIKANRTGTGWTEVWLTPPTQPDYAMVDGVQYRLEQLRLIFVVRE